MKRSHTFGLPLVALAVCSSNALGADSLDPNGSRICDSNRVALAAIDASYTLTNNSDKIIYCAAAQDNGCRPDGGQTFSLQYRILGGSFVNVTSSNGSGPFLASSGTSLTNDGSVTPGERRCNTTGSGQYKQGKEFTTSTSLSYASDWRDDRTEGQWALDFSTSSANATYEFRVRWDTSVCGPIYVTYPAQITTADGETHKWDFDETSGTTAADSLGSSDGTLTNFPGDDSQWSCLDGGSLIFDGVDDYVSLPTEADYDFTDFVSIAAWIKVSSFTVAEQAIITKGDNAYRLERDGSTDMLKFTVDGLTTNTVVQGSVSVNDGFWHHVAGVYDGSELLLYIDGVEDNAVTATGTMDTNNSAAYIGANAAVGGRNFKGVMNHVHMYDSALSPTTIQSLVQAMGSQLGWWKLDETSGTTAYDSSANANNGTLKSMNGTEWTTGRIDGGLDFSGSDDHIDTNVASDQATSITMLTWFKSDDAGSIGNDKVKQRFMSQRRSSGNSRMALGINNDRIAVYWRDGGDTVKEATTDVTAGKWYHAAVTYDGTTVRLYVNGVEDGNWPESSMDAPSADTYLIGCKKNGEKEFDGVLDDVRLYSRALCAAEIAAIYENFVFFTDVSGSVGFDVQSSDDVNSGSGLHWADYDNDGDLDAIITGNNNARLLLSTNEGDSFFVTNFGGGNYPRQGAMLDIDNDGDIDFWHSGESFHENNGSASFSVIGDLGFSNPVATESTAAADVNNDGYCDVLMFSSNGNWFGTHEGDVVETLVGTNDASDGLNDAGDYGAGGYCSSGDVNSDGYLDFFYHYGTGKLFLSNGDGTYTENASGISVATSGTQEVGSAWGDYDNDGDLDLFVPRFASGSSGYLWRNDSGTFVDVTVAAGISDTSGHRGCCWGDFDNDGDLDLYICVSSGANLLYQNQGDGTFTSVSQGADLGGTSQDAVFVDYDNDGDLDLAITQEGATNVLLRNGNNDQAYLKVRLIGHGPALTNKGAIGVRVDLYQSNGTTFIARREIGVARGLGGTEPIWVHFGGLNKNTTYVVKAHFVSGVVDVSVVPKNVSTTISTVTINQMLTIKERMPKIVSWKEVDPR